MTNATVLGSDLDYGCVAAQAGIGAAKRNAGNSWMEAALLEFQSFCQERRKLADAYVVMDDFRSAGRVPAPRNPNAWGALAREAARYGVIRDAGLTTRSTRAAAHARMVRMWEITV